MKLTQREEELMNYLWLSGTALSINEILEQSTERSWRDKYLPVMIRSLEHKKAIIADGMVKYGTQYARRFVPALTKEEYYLQLAVNSGVNLLSFSKIACNLAVVSKSKDEQESIIRELEEIIKEMEKTNKE